MNTKPRPFLAPLTALVILAGFAGLPTPVPAQEDVEPAVLSAVRQMTFAGRRAGEGYFSADGREMVFQSERLADNPFFQIYLLDLETGDTRQVSPGTGKTTCAWIHPDGKKVLFASTHEDPQARAKQEQELADRAAGTEKRYSWDYDPAFDLFAYDLDQEAYIRLTDATGYDAEGAYSPNGSQIVFASNRLAYTEPLEAEDAEIFAHDPAYMMDLYLMNADGSDVRRLTTAKGYDGGPFFSADGSHICWRRFDKSGATAEIYVMNADGTGERQITELGVMSWAPFFHPSGEYLIFTTNKHGFDNFELYLVDAEGEGAPARVTDSPGFDGLPAFAPDGKTLAWTSNRTPDKTSQIFFGAWDHEAALALLRGHAEREEATELDAIPPALEPLLQEATTPAITEDDLRFHVGNLASETMAGRLTGTEGERLATRYVAEFFDRFNLEPAGSDGSFFQTFTFTAGISLGVDNTLRTETDAGVETYAPDEQWRPLAFSATGAFEPAEIVFAGYGIIAPEGDNAPAYDSYVHLDVQDKWVIVLRYIPDNVTPEVRQHLNRYASLRYKAMIARDRGARGVIFVSGPASKVENQLPRLSFDVSLGSSSIAAIAATDSVVAGWLSKDGKDLAALQQELDSGEPAMGFTLKGLALAAEIDLVKEERTGRNVLARLVAPEAASDASAVVIGAHVDHLGTGQGSSSLAENEAEGQVHYGADDNASGVAALLEIAQHLADLQKHGELGLNRNVIFAAWSGEELGLLGSDHFVEGLAQELASPDDISSAVAAYLNMDMIGRLNKTLVLNGGGSSPLWAQEVEQRNVPIGLPIKLQQDSYLPTDTTSFYLKHVPVLCAFSGVHDDYHTPGDTPDKINYGGAQQIARLMMLITRSLAEADGVPEYRASEAPEMDRARGGMRAYLGTIPDYAETDVPGVKLDGVTEGAPAAVAGLLAGDVIIELAGQKIENVYDYTYAIQALKVGETVPIVVQRGEEQVSLEITPGSRE